MKMAILGLVTLMFAACNDSKPDPVDIDTDMVETDLAVDTDTDMVETDAAETDLPIDTIEVDPDPDPVDTDETPPSVDTDETEPVETAPPATPQVTCERSPASPESRILLGGTSNNMAVVFSCTARGETVVVDGLMLTSCVTDTPDQDRDCADQGEWAGLDEAVAQVQLVYTNTAGVRVTMSRVFRNGETHFSGLDLLLIEGIPTRIEAWVDVGTVDTAHVPSGESIQLNLDTRGMTGVGETTQTPAAIADDYILGSKMVLRHSRPSVTVAVGSPSGVRPAGDDEVFRYSITAAGQGDIGNSGVLFGIDSTDRSGSGWNTCENLGLATKWELVDTVEPSVSLDAGGRWTFYDENGELCDPGDTLGYAYLSLTTTVHAGTSRTFSLSADLTDADPIWADEVTIYVPDQDEADSVGRSAIFWDDIEGQAFGIDGRYLPGLPAMGHAVVANR